MTGSSVVTAAQSTGPTGEAHDVVAGRSSPDEVCRFLTDAVPAILAAALVPLLPDGIGQVRAVVTRAKLKPGRKLTVSVDVSGDGIAARPAALGWGASAPSALPDALLEQVTHAQRSPFSTLALPPDASGMSVFLAPVDPAFPQLLDVYDPARIARLLSAAGVAGFGEGPRVLAVRYRPGQRHVVLVESADGRRRLYAKCYRDDSGRRAVDASRIVAEALSRAGGPADTARAAGYSDSHRLALWTGHEGMPLSRVVSGGADGTPIAVTQGARAGAALRAIHEGGGRTGVLPDPGAGSRGRSDPATEAAATRRAVEHVAPLAPQAAARLETLLVETMTELVGLPVEAGHLVHGDYKCDNMLVDDDRLVLLDFDRVTIGDPAVDVGKFVADLRWWARASNRSATALVHAFLDGYGPCPPERLARASCYDVLFQLRAVGRRIPLHAPGWAETVDACLEATRRSRGSGP